MCHRFFETDVTNSEISQGTSDLYFLFKELLNSLINNHLYYSSFKIWVLSRPFRINYNFGHWTKLEFKFFITLIKITKREHHFKNKVLKNWRNQKIMSKIRPTIKVACLNIQFWRSIQQIFWNRKITMKIKMRWWNLGSH